MVINFKLYINFNLNINLNLNWNLNLNFNFNCNINFNFFKFSFKLILIFIFLSLSLILSLNLNPSLKSLVFIFIFIFIGNIKDDLTKVINPSIFFPTRQFLLPTKTAQFLQACTCTQLQHMLVDECIFNELELILRFFTADFTHSLLTTTTALTHVHICSYKQPNCCRPAASDEQRPL